MRLRRLDLTRYGKFTDSHIDFGPKPEDGPDLHVVFGLNEAGKSTAFSGFLDLLFGIEERSRYNFLHEYAAMRVGGVLDLAGEEQVFTRVKQRANSLLDGSGQPVGEMALSAHLAGLSRDAYGTMFSLDDETLEAGGKAILESKGDLGRLLFTASAGLANASDSLLAMEAEAEGLYRKHSHSTELALLKKRLAELKVERDAIDTLGSTFEALEAERQDTTEKYDRTVAERSAMVARLDAIARLTRAIPMLAEYRRKAARLDGLPSMVSPPRTWAGSVPDLMISDADIRARISANAAELERLSTRQAETRTDEAILTVSERIRGLTDRKARHVAAGLDLPGRRTELCILENAVADILASLGRTGHPDAKELLLPAATTSIVRSMFEQRPGLNAATRAGRDELAAAVEALDMARARVGEERSVPVASRARLEAALEMARGSGHAQERRLATKLLEEGRGLWESALARLHPWSGTGAELAALSLPSLRQVSTWRTALVELRSKRAGLTARLEECAVSKRSLAKQLEELTDSADVADDETALQVRASREAAWTTHRHDLRPDSADAFASAMMKDDSVGASRLAKARELEEIRSTTAALEELGDVIDSVGSDVAGIDAARASLVANMVGSAAGIGSLDASAPEEMLGKIEDFIADRAVALDSSRRLDSAHRTLDRLAQEEDRMRSELLAAMDRVGVPYQATDSLQTAVGVTEHFLARQAKLDAEHAEALRTVRTREEELTTRRRTLETAERREEEWLDGITDALAGTWLASGLPAAAVGGVLEQLSTLSKALQERDAMRLRVEKMETDRAAFLAEVSVLADQSGQPLNGREPEQTASQLTERLEAAERSRATALALADDKRVLLGTRDELIAEHAIIDAAKAEVLRAFAVETLEEVVEREDALRERDRLREAQTELEEQLRSDLGVDVIEQVEAMLDGVDVSELAVEKLEMEQRLKDIDDALKEHVVRLTRATDKLDAIGGDSAVARLDARRRTTLLEIEEKAAHYIRLRLGILAAGNALRVYRDRHRSAMMTRASDAFALMTQGHYSGLATQPVKGGEVLIALQRDGSSKVADALSKGARFQLYLALRLAGYHEFAQVRPPVPFVADDIMETFDHVRSEEVFRLFGDMAKVGQVIYLTHHRHLCDIAREVVPGVKVHELA